MMPYSPPTTAKHTPATSWCSTSFSSATQRRTTSTPTADASTLATAIRSSVLGISTARRERADGGRDVAAQACQGTAVRRGDGSVVLALHGLAGDRAPRARRPTGGLAHHPHGVDEDALARRRVEALYLDRDPVVGIEVGER